jgi:archaellum component FlaC
VFITNINVSPHKRLWGLTVSVEVLKDIREELKELRVLYKELVEKLIPVEEPTSEEKRAIAEKDEIADEREMMKALGKTNVRR